MAFAIIQTGGKQYRVSPGDTIQVEKLPAEEGTAVSFDEVLMMVDGDKVSIGEPLLQGTTVTGKVLEQGRAKKVIIFKYKNKTRQRRKKGHRQHYSKVEITGIQ
ncbi:MAG: 50S ribosomal protein L21 [Candidatus Harrisonbacteria bacterium]|nr:50S ribosomal protein L21 [Candidatus Harrisonbacteria bacterium]